MLDPIVASRLFRLLVSIIFVGLAVPALAADRPFMDPPMLFNRRRAPDIRQPLRYVLPPGGEERQAE
jgi:hypothetical protein